MAASSFRASFTLRDLRPKAQNQEGEGSRAESELALASRPSWWESALKASLKLPPTARGAAATAHTWGGGWSRQHA